MKPLKTDIRWLIALSAAVIILGVWSYITIQTDLEYQRTVMSITRENNNLCKALEEHVRRTIINVNDKILDVKYDYERKGHVDSELQNNLKRMVKDPALYQMGIVNEAGYFAGSAVAALPLTNVADRQYFRIQKEHKAYGIFLDVPLLGRVTGLWNLSFSERINKPDGSFGGVVVASVAPEYFGNFFKTMDIGKERSIVVVGRDGIARVRVAGNNTTLGDNLSHGDLMKQAMRGPIGTYLGRFTDSDIERFSSFRTLPEYQLIVSVGVGKDEALAAFYKRRVDQYGVAFLITLLVAGFSIALIKQLTKQFQLQDAALEKANELNSIYTALDDAILIINQQAAVIKCNDAAGRLLGLPPEEIIGQVLFGDGWKVVDENEQPLPLYATPVQTALSMNQAVRGRMVGVEKKILTGTGGCLLTASL